MTSQVSVSDRSFRLVFLALLIPLLSACATSAYAPAPAAAADEDYTYLIGPGDSLNIVVWRNPELSMVVPVRPDGRITTPLVEDLLVSGKGSSQVARDIEVALELYIREPVVTVVVSQFRGPYSEQIRVIGEATDPKTIPYVQRMTLLDVMIEVGGVTDFAAGNRASILRVDEGGGTQYGIRINDLLKKGDVSANVEMRPGDVVIIPQSWF